jgi:hypothetical protein
MTRDAGQRGLGDGVEAGESFEVSGPVGDGGIASDIIGSAEGRGWIAGYKTRLV